MAPSWLVPAVFGFLGGSFAVWLLRASSRPPELVGTGLILRLPRAFGTLAVFCGVGFPLLLLIGALADPSLDEGEVIWGSVAFIVVVGVAGMCWATSRQILIVNDEGLEQRLPWRRVRRVAWDDVVNVRVAVFPAYLEFHGRNAELVRVGPSLDGIPDLVLIAKRKLEPALWRDAVASLARWDARLAE